MPEPSTDLIKDFRMNDLRRRRRAGASNGGRQQ
jgi:hypothetical protein